MKTRETDVSRSFLRKREAEWRRNPPHDAHVRLYFASTTPTQRKMFDCPRCGRSVRNLERPRDQASRMAKHCGCVTRATADLTLPAHMRPAQRTKRLEYKRQARRQRRAEQGREIRFFRKCQAHVEAWKVEVRRRERLHDAHVIRYRYVVAYRARWDRVKDHECIRINRTKRREKERATLHDRYILRLLTDSRCLAAVRIPGELIAVKRAQIKLKRLINDMTEVEQTNEDSNSTSA